MGKRKIWFFVSLTIVVIVLFLLLTGSSILTVALDDNDSVALGTFITWIGIISLPTTIYLGVEKLRQPKGRMYKILSNSIKMSLILAVLWIPISFLLAGNISFNFSEKTTFQGGQLAMKWFWRISYGIVIAPLIILICHWVLVLKERWT